MTVAMTVREREAREGQIEVPADWPETLHLSGWHLHEPGETWYAICNEFNITGQGATVAAAEAEMFQLLHAYLASYAREGRPFAETRRPVPLRRRVYYRALAVVSPVLQRLHRRSVDRETDFEIHPSACLN